MSKIFLFNKDNMVVGKLNDSMDLLGENYSIMASIHESVAKMAENQEKQAKLLAEIAEILKINVINEGEINGREQ